MSGSSSQSIWTLAWCIHQIEASNVSVDRLMRTERKLHKVLGLSKIEAVKDALHEIKIETYPLRQAGIKIRNL